MAIWMSTELAGLSCSDRRAGLGGAELPTLVVGGRVLACKFWWTSFRRQRVSKCAGQKSLREVTLRRRLRLSLKFSQESRCSVTSAS
jgi:hypothetical protein